MIRNAETNPPPILTLDRAVRLSKALAHPARLRVLSMLRTGDACVCQITAVLGLAISTVSGHLAELRRAGLVQEEKRGRWVYYHLAVGEVAGPLAEELLGQLARDSQARADVDLLEQIRLHLPEALCEAGLDLASLGIGERSVEKGARR